MAATDQKVKARAFLAAYRQTGNITKAAAAAKIDRTLHYRWLKKLAGYEKEFEEAEQELGDVLEAEAIRRANEGTLKPVFYQGSPCGAIREYSDTLMLALLRRFKPKQ